jgi:hypothetical protein
MVTSEQCIKKYGDPNLQKSMKLYELHSILKKEGMPRFLEDYTLSVLPKKIYCNVDMIKPLTKSLTALIRSSLIKELVTWDGCFCIRKKRTNNSYSLHSWGIAFDINAYENPQGIGDTKGFSEEFVKCFTDNGFDWGGNWKGATRDAMHFQLASI